MADVIGLLAVVRVFPAYWDAVILGKQRIHRLLLVHPFNSVEDSISSFICKHGVSVWHRQDLCILRVEVLQSLLEKRNDALGVSSYLVYELESSHFKSSVGTERPKVVKVRDHVCSVLEILIVRIVQVSLSSHECSDFLVLRRGL